MVMLDIVVPLTRGSAADPIARIAAVQTELLAVAESVAKKQEVVSPSMLSSLRGATAEAGVYLRRGETFGALANIGWNARQPDEARITVRALSKAQVTLIWVSLGTGLALGLGGAFLVGPFEDGRVALLLGLALGLALGLLMIFAVLKLQIGARPESIEMGERLAAAVQAWSERAG